MLNLQISRVGLVCSLLIGLVATGCGGGGGTSSPASSGTTNNPPNQVALAAVSSQDISSLSVAWQSAVDDSTPSSEIRYQVHASTANDFVPSANTLLFDGVGVNSANINGLQAGTSYRVKLVAIDQSGASTVSAAMVAKTADIGSLRTTAAVHVSASATPVIAENSLTFPAGAAPSAKVGDVLVSDVGNGYLRKVVNVENGPQGVVIQTQPASLNEVFSEIELSSSVNLATVNSASGGLVTAASAGGKNGMAVAHWPESGLTISGPAVTTVTPQGQVVAPQMRALALRTSDKTLLANGAYGWVNGPQSVSVEVGDSVQVPFDVRSRTLDVKICKIEYLDAEPHAGGGDPGGLAALGTSSIKSTMGPGASTWTIQNIRLTPTKDSVLKSDYYVVRARAYFDDAGDDCESLFNVFKEKIDFSFNVAVTNPGDALPVKYGSSVDWQGDFKASNKVEFNFDPVFDSSVRIRGASLQSAVTKVKGALGVTQTLTIDASGSGALKPQIKVLSPERTFKKVFLVGGVPVIISGSFVLKGKVEGSVTGAMNVTETFDYGFPDFEFGVQYSNGVWTPIKNMNPSYKLVVKGTGDAKAILAVSLIPEFNISAYEVATGRIAVEPKLTANAAIEGHFVFQDADGQLATDADYRFTAMDVSGGAKAYAMADLTVYDKTLAAWPSKSAKSDDYTTWQDYEPVPETRILGLPDIEATVAVDQQMSGDAKTALITAKAKPVPNPLNVVDHAPIIAFGNWLTAYPVEPTGGLKIKSVEAGGTSDSVRLWVSYAVPGHYKVRIPAQSALKLRQYIDVEFDIPDADGDGMADPWEKLYGIESASDDPNHDGRNNLVEFKENTNPLATGKAPTIMSSADSAVVGQQLLLWINNAYVNAKAVVWSVGERAASVAVSIGDQFTAVFDRAGAISVSAALQDAVGTVLGSVSRVFSVQDDPALVPRVDAVIPAMVTAGQSQTFTVTGANLSTGLGFNLTDCGGVTEVLIGTTNTQRKFTCTFPLGATAGIKEGAIGAGTGGNPFEAVLKNFSVTLKVPSVQTVAPVETVRTLATSFQVTGIDLPTSGLSVTVPGDGRASCQAPNNMTTTGFGVACQLYTLGTQNLEIRQGATVLGNVRVNVKTNVTGVTWTSPSTTGSGTVKFGEDVLYKVAGTNLLADPVMGFAVEKCGVSNTEVGVPSNTLRSFTCNFNNVAGAVAGQMPGVVKDAPGGQVLFDGWKVPVEVAPVQSVVGISPSSAVLGVATTFTITGQNLPLTPIMTLGGTSCQIQSSPAPTASGFTAVCTLGGVVGNQVVRIADTANNVIDQSKSVNVSVSGFSASKLPHTGITSSQCYAAGSDALVSCSSSGAVALSGVGKQDGMYADVSPMSYSRVGAYPLTSCVKDNVTGLIWEGKEASGTRAGSNTYTNWGDGRAGDASAYVAAVNAQALCGYTDWRLPAVDELQGVVDYSKQNSWPKINTDVFVNTRSEGYWTSSLHAGGINAAWGVNFGSGYVGAYGFSSNSLAIRLVRASQ